MPSSVHESALETLVFFLSERCHEPSYVALPFRVANSFCG
jgi:hypothetical protein